MTRRFSISLVSLIVLTGAALGQSTFSGTGLWSDPARWSAGVPTAATDATIANNATCTVDIAAVAASLNIAGGANNTTLTISGSNSLTIGGSVTINAPTANNINKIIDVSAGSLSAASLSMATTTANSRDCILSISTGTVTVSGDITMNGVFARNHIDWTGDGRLYVGGNMTGGGLTMGTTGTVEYNGAGAQTAGGAYTYNNMTVNSGGTVTIGGNTTVSGDLTVTSGTLVFGAFTTSVSDTTRISGALQITSTTGTKTFIGPVVINTGGIWNNTIGEAVTLQGGLTHNGADFISGAGTYTFSTNSQIIDGSSPLTFSGAVAISGTITITNQNSSPSGVTILGNLTGTVAGSTWQNDPNTILAAGNALLATGTLSATAVGNTVQYVGTVAQTVKAATYHNLGISNTSATGATIGSDLTIDNNVLVSGSGALLRIGNSNIARSITVGGNISVETGASFNVNAGSNTTHTLTLAGDITNDGTVNFAPDGNSFSTLVLAGTGAQTIGGSSPLTLSNIDVNNTSGIVFVNTNVTTAGALTVSAGATLEPSGSVIFNSGGAAGTMTGAGTVRVTRSGVVNPDYLTQYNFSTYTLTNLTVDYNATGDQTVNGLNYFNLIIQGSRSSSSVTLENGGIIGISGSFTPSATFTTGGYQVTGSTVDFNGSVVQSIPAFTFNNVIVSNTGAKDISSAVTVNADLTVNVGASLTVAGTGTVQVNGVGLNNGSFTNNGTIIFGTE